MDYAIYNACLKFTAAARPIMEAGSGFSTMCDNQARPQEPVVVSNIASSEELAINSGKYAPSLPLEQFTAGSSSDLRHFRFSQPTEGQAKRREPHERAASFSSGSMPSLDKTDKKLAAERLQLEALSRYQTCGALRGAGFDDLARIAAFICKTPISLVSLVDSARQWFLSSTGIDVCEASREVSFCAQALIGPDMLIVPDVHADARFADNPLVTADPEIRFFAGAPLVSPDGYTLGTLCVIDRVPRNLNREQKAALASLSRLAVSQLEAQRLKLSPPTRS